MITIINNPWVIGIGGGILSGLIVTLISRLILSKRENREYIQKIHAANKEILYAIRPGISEGQLPIITVINALRNSTARKYSVTSDDIWSASEISDELIKEVMDSSFISSSAKQEFCEKLRSLAESAEKTDQSTDIISGTVSREKAYLLDSTSRMIRVVSTMMGVMAGTMSALLVVFPGLNDLAAVPFNDLSILLPAVSTVVIAGAALFFSVLLREFRDLRKRSTQLDFEEDKPNKLSQLFRNRRSHKSAPPLAVKSGRITESTDEKPSPLTGFDGSRM